MSVASSCAALGESLSLFAVAATAAAAAAARNPDANGGGFGSISDEYLTRLDPLSERVDNTGPGEGDGSGASEGFRRRRLSAML